ncbi:MAG: SPOR domain-containing protein [Bacteroidales bacterium]|nr:SPOR domain-containing protein [Bacteroidales bacterium]
MEKYINEILEKNNRVIVPDFGAFIVKQRKPLTIVFNEFLQYNDGMLIDAISKSENLDREKAKEKVEDFVKAIVAKLDKGEKYPVGKLGILIKSSAGKISLEGDEIKTISKAKPVPKTAEKQEKTKTEESKAEKDKKAKADQDRKIQEDTVKAEKEKAEQEEKEKAEREKKEQEEKAKAEREKKEQEEKAKTEKERKEEETLKAKQNESISTPSPSSKTYSYTSTGAETEYHKKNTSRRNILLWIIVIVVINGILITGYFIYNKDLPSFFKKSDADELLLEEPVIEEDNYVTESYDEVPEVNETEGTIVEEEAFPEKETIPKVTKPKQTIQGTKYYVVAGAFSNEQNADNLVIELRNKGYNAEKFGNLGSLHAVSYDVFNNKQDADRFLRTIQDKVDPQAWIKKVN